MKVPRRRRPQVAVSSATVIFAWPTERAEAVAHALALASNTKSCPEEMRGHLSAAWADLQRGIHHARSITPIDACEGGVMPRAIRRGAE